MEDSENDVSLSGNANEIVDKVLKKFKWALTDPFPINIKSETLIINDGQISGLSNIRRCGDCTFIADDRDTKIKLQLEVPRISFNINYEVLVGLIWIKGEIGAVAKGVAVNLQVSLAEDKIRLNSFEVPKLKDYAITNLTGVTPVFNRLFKFLLNGIMHAFKDRLLKTLEREVKESLESLINKIPLSKL